LSLRKPQTKPPQGGLATFTLSRRGLLQLMGAGIAVAALPSTAACRFETAPGPDDDSLLRSAKWFVVSRKDDLVVLSFGVIGFDVIDAKKTAPPQGTVLKGSLYLGRTSGPAYLLVKHLPQHVLEEAFIEPIGYGPPTPGTVPAGGPVQHRIARKTRLSFSVPDAVLAIPFELDAILATLSTLKLHVAPNAWDEPPGSTILYVPAFAPIPVVPRDALPVPVAEQMKRALRAARARKRRLAFHALNPETTLRPRPDGALHTADAIVRTGPILPQAPSGLSTQIEMPYRLVISPNANAGFEHAASPVVSKSGRVELWHSRLATPEGWQKTIRALWTRDNGFVSSKATVPVDDNPFRASMTSQNRADVVHLTTNFGLIDENDATLARAVNVESLMLSSLGGWIDSHGAWQRIKGGTGFPDVAAWDHRATMGRDQKVRVEHYGRLYPFGHEAIWVTVSERKLVPGFEEAAYVWQHSYVIVKQPLATYDTLAAPLTRGFPFTSVRFKTLVTPNVDAIAGVAGLPGSSWVLIGGSAFPFEVEAFDHEGNAHTFTTACIWIAQSDLDKVKPMSSAADDLAKEWATADGGARRASAMKSQRVALAPSDDLDDTTHTTKTMAHKATVLGPGGAPFVPQLDYAELAIDAVRTITGTDAATTFKYLQRYVDEGFDDAMGAVKNVTGAFMQLADGAEAQALQLSQQSQKSGGFAAPDLSVTGLSRAQGLLSGDPMSLVGTGVMFDASKFFDATGKLFGVLKLSFIIDALGGKDILKQAPKFITQTLDAAELVFHTFENARSIGDDLKNRILAAMKNVIDAIPNVSPLTQTLAPTIALTPIEKQLYDRVLAKAAALGLSPMQLTAERKQLEMALDAVLAAGMALKDDVVAVGAVTPSTDLTKLADKTIADIKKARDALDALGGVLKSLVLPIDEGVKAQLLMLYEKIVVQIFPSQKELDEFHAIVVAFVNAEDAIKSQHVKLEWSPTISAWPTGSEIFWPNDKQGLRIGAEIRGKSVGNAQAGATVYASLTDFELRLIGKNDFIKLVFDRLVFKAGTDGKTTVDVGFRGVHFDGTLSFIETIRRFIPLDGFSDPPNLQVSTSGISASFTLPLPNVAIGVFSLENLSISAGFSIPFIGKSLTVDFAFCKRESPFVLTVCMLGGGGFVGLSLTPDGVRLLEIALEAQAALAVDFGVASGSVSVALGIYFAVEDKDCKLSGYFRLRGDVQVLGIVHASIELKLELSYETMTGKVVGRAKLEIEVSVFCFSASVTIECEKKFSGKNSDPTFRQVLAYDGGYAPWDDYCGAFTMVAA